MIKSPQICRTFAVLFASEQNKGNFVLFILYKIFTQICLLRLRKAFVFVLGKELSIQRRNKQPPTCV